MSKSCQICKSENLRQTRILKNYRFCKCLNCFSEFIVDIPKREVVNFYNLKRYNSINNERLYIGYQNIFLKRAYKIINVLKKYKRKGQVLDVGCSYGFYLKAFKEMGYDVFGIDVSKKSIRFVTEVLQIDAINADFNSYLFKENSFNIVTMIDVVEHFSSPNKIVSKIYQILDKNGVLIIQTPNVESLMSKITGNDWFWLLTPEHLFLYSPRSLEILLEKNGFRILEMSTWDDFDEFVKNILWTFRFKDKGKTRYFYYFLYRIMMLMSPLSLIWNRLNLGGEIVVYAQKKE